MVERRFTIEQAMRWIQNMKERRLILDLLRLFSDDEIVDLLKDEDPKNKKYIVRIILTIGIASNDKAGELFYSDPKVYNREKVLELYRFAKRCLYLSERIEKGR